MILTRNFYLNKLIQHKNNERIKIVTGIRRCGKSFLLMNLFHSHLLNTGVHEDHIIAVSLEEYENRDLRNPDTLYKAILGRITDNEKYYILIDEAQLAITEDERKNPNKMIALYGILNSFLHKNTDVYITGSNSRFLSSDIRTEFRGRGDEIHITPLTFREFLQNTDKNPDDAFKEYLLYGGMPYLQHIQNPEEKINYLKELFNETYFKDIVERYKIERIDVLSELTDYLCSSVGYVTNVNKLKNSINSLKKSNKQDQVSYETVNSYIKYLKDSFLFSEVQRYDIIGKKHFESLSKFYCADHGLRNAKLNMRQNEETHLMENIIYNHLISFGYSVDVGIIEKRERADKESLKYRQYEIDFVVNRGSNQFYIQSAFSIDSDEKRSAELKPFSIINNSFKKIIVTRFGTLPWYDENGVLHISITDFLLRDDVLV